MKTEKKIFLGKSDGVNFAVQSLQETSAELVILNVPRDSVLGKAIDNFHILKNKALLLNKNISIESLDEKILEMASAAGLRSLNPLFRRSEKLISDIVPKSQPVPKAKVGKMINKEEPAPEPAIPGIKLKAEKRPELPKIFFEPKEPVPKIISFEERRPPRPRSRRRLLVTAVILILIVPGGFLLANNFLPEARITLTLKESVFPFNENVQAEISAKEAAISPKIVLPAELITTRKNLVLRFPATGSESVERKAVATLVVYNAYSSEPQILVQNTRFMSPEGKIFRLDAKTTVPGAKIMNNKIEASKISVAVTADKPGGEYNVLPSSSWRIPGFKGTPRYDGFYAELPSAASGGFVGVRPVPTKEDKEKARTDVLAKLENVLESEIKILISPRFKVFLEARQFRLVGESTDEADTEGNFGYIAVGELKYLVFEEEMVKQALKDKAIALLEDKNLGFREFEANYSSSTADFAAGRLSFGVSGAMTLVPNIEVGKLKADILGATEDKLKQAVFFLPGLEKANVSLWPFWVTKVPKNPDRVEIEVN